MKETFFTPTVLLLCLTVVWTAASMGDAEPSTEPLGLEAPVSTGTVKATLADARLPLYFIENRGQMDARVRFYARVSRFTLWVTEGEMVFDRVLDPRVEHSGHTASGSPLTREVVRMVFPGAAETAAVDLCDPQKGTVNYFLGGDEDVWRTGLATGRAVRYRQLFPGIDLKIYGVENQIEYDWIIAPGADPSRIRFSYRGAVSTRIDRQGNLEVVQVAGRFLHRRPVAYQMADGRRIEVAARFAPYPDGVFGIRVGEYDASKPLIVDPLVLLQSTYLGGGGYDQGRSIAVDGDGYIYLAGSTSSTNFPTRNQYQTDQTGEDAFLSKFDPEPLLGMLQLLYSSYLGGGGYDAAYGVAALGSGVVVVGGSTGSSDFPTLNPYQTDQTGFDAFLVKLDTTQTGVNSLLYATYLGGSDGDECHGVAVDGSGYAYLVGNTGSSDFPTLNPYQTNQGGTDVYLAKLDTTQSGSACLLYATYLGGDGMDLGWGVAVDGNGYAYLAGNTGSSDFPTLNPYQTDQTGTDAFLSKIDPSQSGAASLLYSTYLGGDGNDEAHGVAVGSGGDAYLAGNTESSDFPLVNAYQTTQANQDAVVARVDTTQSGTASLAYSTRLGGDDWDGAQSIATDGGGAVVVTGGTGSGNFPTKGAYQGDQTDGDAFVTKLDTDQTGTASLVFSSYLGGSANDYGNAIALDGSENIYVCGGTDSSDFPLMNAYQSNQPSTDAFFSKLVFSDVDGITLTAPNGGESYAVYSPMTISWEWEGDFENVRIEFSPDNGSSWTDIVSSTANDGGYTWTVPLSLSDTCLIRIGDTDGEPQDESDAAFSIVDPEDYSDEGLAAAACPDGGFLLAGRSNAVGAGEDDMLVYRIDAAGTVLWQKTYGGAADEVCESVQATSDGGFVLAGTSDTYTHGGCDMLIFRVDAAGAKLWRKNYGGDADDVGHVVRQTADGGYILAGTTASYTSGSGDLDFLVYRLDAAGNKLWRKHYGGSGDDWGHDIRQTVDGGYIFLGTTDSYVHGVDDVDFLIYRMDAAGNKLWRKNYGGTLDDSGHWVEPTADGGYLVFGTTCSYTSGTGDTDLLAYKLDAGGQKAWRKNYGGPGDDSGLSFVTAPEGGYMLTGTSRSHTNGAEDFYLFGVDAAGGKTWRKNYGGIDEDTCFQAVAASGNGYLLVGRTLSYTTTAGFYDVLVYRIGPDGAKAWRYNYGY